MGKSSTLYGLRVGLAKECVFRTRPARIGASGIYLRISLFSSGVLADGEWHIERHYPTQAQKQGLTPISRHARARRVRVCAFHYGKAHGCINATRLRRKSGQTGHPPFVAGVAKTLVEFAWARCGAPPSTSRWLTVRKWTSEDKIEQIGRRLRRYACDKDQQTQ
jgi:hypothetical protein